MGVGEAECGEEDSVGKGEDRGWNKERQEVSGTAAGLRCLAFGRLVIPMSFARPDATMKDNPARDEQCANERLESIEHQHSARGPVADEPTQRRNGIQPKSGKERAEAHR